MGTGTPSKEPAIWFRIVVGAFMVAMILLVVLLTCLREYIDWYNTKRYIIGYIIFIMPHVSVYNMLCESNSYRITVLTE